MSQQRHLCEKLRTSNSLTCLFYSGALWEKCSFLSFQAKSKKNAASSPRKKVEIPNTNCAPHAPQTAPHAPLPAAPPAAVVSSAPLRLPPVSVNSDTTVSSTQNPSVAPPPSILTNQHAASSTSSMRVGFSSDHDYSLRNIDSASGLPSPASSCISDHNPKKSSKAPLRGRKRARVEEPLRMTSSQDDQCVDGAGDAVGGACNTLGGASTGVAVEGKRIQKPSQRARTLQEAAQNKVRPVSLWSECVVLVME